MLAYEKKLLDSYHVGVCAQRFNLAIIRIGSAAGIIESKEAQGARPASRSQHDRDCVGEICGVHANPPWPSIDLRANGADFQRHNPPAPSRPEFASAH